MASKKVISTLQFLAFVIALHAQSSAHQGLTITPVSHDFYVYTTYRLFNDNPFPSNSAYLVTTAGVVLFDTPWDTTQFQPLLDSIQKRHQKEVVMCIATHFHDDRTAGLDFYKNKGIKTWSSQMTYDLCDERNEKQAEYYFAKDSTFTIGNYSFQTYYPGEGHSKDNIIIWLPSDRVLYGGCFVKSVESAGLGNIADANLAKWKKSIKKVRRKYPNLAYVIPGHFGWQDKNALQHTLNLLNQTLKN